MKKKILIIKFGGLGDFILSLHAINTVRKFHAKDDIALLTERPYDLIANKSGWFKDIIKIKRSPFYFLDKIKIKSRIKESEFDIIYDFQTSKRSSSYYSIFRNTKTKWSGVAEGCSNYHLNQNRNQMHTLERQKDQLIFSEIHKSFELKVDWLFQSKIMKDMVAKPFVVLAPGGSAKRKYKRIPSEIFMEISKILEKNEIMTVLVGTKEEKKICDKIQNQCDRVINLCEKLDILELAILAGQSEVAIGNDTGPMHLFGLSGCKTIVFFTKFSNPDLCSPRGKDVQIIKFDGNKNNLMRKTMCLLTELNEQLS
jgi:ADP-heptose:LPS heptosyltransferase|tara:strand:+ start:176 stop:1111 length:936 start_codon:yes stop_codon:yes gene_type:complete